MDHVFHRNPLHSYPLAVAGDGVYLYDRDGRRYLDASGGTAVSCLGHSDGGSGFFQHGYTYLGHAAACAGALAAQHRLRKDGVLAQVKPIGELLQKSLHSAFAKHPHVGDIRGRGLFWTLELVADRASKRPFEPPLRLHARIKQEALNAGLLCYPMGGTIDGVNGDHVLLAPPFVIEPGQIEELVHKLGRALESALVNT